jgi:hypothetical protein
VDKLTQSIGTLVKSLEEMMNHLKDQLNVSMPAGYDLKQTAAAAKLEITGTFAGKTKMEDAVNNDCFMQQTFQALRIRYTELREYSAGQMASSACNSSGASQPFCVSFKDGKATLNASDISASLFDKLIEELDRYDEKKKKQVKTHSIPEGTGNDNESGRNHPDTVKDKEKESAPVWI